MDLIKQLKTPDYITGFAESRIGGRSENQDSFDSADTPFGYVVTVCDGMGGGPGGKTASSIAVKEIINGIQSASHDDTAINIVIKAIRRANLAILEAGKINPPLKGMGSTCTVLLINESSAIVAHVGDSRVYQLRGKNKVFRTFDHSMVFDLVKQKVITEEQARLSAQSNVITRALGIKPDIEVDAVELPYLAGDRFLLSTDGIHGSVAETDLIEMVADKKHALGTVTDEIATTIDGKGRNEGGGHDNLTLAIIETKINSNLKPKMNRQTKLILGAISLICLISLIFNGVLLGRNDSAQSQKLNCAIDSLSHESNQKDSVISELKIQLNKITTDKAGSQSELSNKIQKIEKENNRIKAENIELRKEIDKLKIDKNEAKENTDNKLTATRDKNAGKGQRGSKKKQLID